jgi:hypothetical protein
MRGASTVSSIARWTRLATCASPASIIPASFLTSSCANARMMSSVTARHPPRLAGYIAFIFVALLPLGVASASLFAPPADGPVAAVFPLWWDDSSAFAAAGTAGPVVRLGALPFIVIVAATDRSRLRAAGAWLLLDPRVLGACRPPTSA